MYLTFTQDQHKLRCDALVILDCQPSEVVHVPLPDFSYDDALRLHKQLTEVLRDMNLLNRLRGDDTDDQERALKCRNTIPKRGNILTDILANLWTSVVKPIVDSIITKVGIVF